MNPEFWNARYDSKNFAYGTTPISFLVEESNRLPPDATVVELGAGEGRNAVYLAEAGFRVTAVDYAERGLSKLQRLARERGVHVETICTDVLSWNPPMKWDVVVISFLHMPLPQRFRLYELIKMILRPGGLLLAQWYHPDQVRKNYDTGGPKNASLMPDLEELLEHFPAEGVLVGKEEVAFLDEGAYHRGPGAGVRFVWKNILPHTISDGGVRP